MNFFFLLKLIFSDFFEELPRLEIGHKSNRMAIYNCTGGSNGDLPSNLSLSDISDVTSNLLSNDAWINKIVHLKSSLIDLETYGNSYGDRAQA